MQRETIQHTIASLLEPLLSAQGFELVDLQVQPRRSQWLVRLFVDTPGGIGLEDCRRLSGEIGHLLDADDLIPVSYRLEVSSPGLDRPLHTVRDFQRHMQRLVRVFLRAPVDDQVQYVGRVVEVTADHLLLQVSPEALRVLPFALIDHGTVEVEFR